MPLFFVYFSYFITDIHTFIQSHSSVAIRWGLSPFLHRLFAQWGNLPVVPSRESNSGLPYSKPTRYQLSHAAPYRATPHHKEPRRTMLSHAAPYWATPHHTEPRRTMINLNFILLIQWGISGIGDDIANPHTILDKAPFYLTVYIWYDKYFSNTLSAK